MGPFPPLLQSARNGAGAAHGTRSRRAGEQSFGCPPGGWHPPGQRSPAGASTGQDVRLTRQDDGDGLSLSEPWFSQEGEGQAQASTATAVEGHPGSSWVGRAESPPALVPGASRQRKCWRFRPLFKGKTDTEASLGPCV